MMRKMILIAVSLVYALAVGTAYAHVEDNGQDQTTYAKGGGHKKH